MEQTLEDLLQIDGSDPVPRVDDQSLETVHRSLESKLQFPFDAIYSEPAGEDQDVDYQVTVHRLLPVSDHPVFGPYLGILCECNTGEEAEEIVIPLARITEVQSDHNRILVEAYVEWFWNFR